MAHRGPLIAVQILFALALALAITACTTADTPIGEDGGISFTAPDARSDGANADGGMAPISVGSPCAADADCPEGAPVCLVTDGFRDGHCTEYCIEGADTCPTGSHCTQIRFMVMACLVDCDPRAERPCRVGYGCGERAPAAPVCAPGCDVDEDCETGLMCNREDGGLGEGECFDPTAGISDPCTEPEQCASDSWCIRERDRGWPGGACTIFGCNDVDNTGCPGDAQCVFDFYRDPICVDGCMLDDDCRQGYRCLPDEMFPERVRCTPSCTSDDDCLEAGHTCDVPTGRCVL